MSRPPRPGGKLREARAAGPTVDLDEARLAKLRRLMAHRQIKSAAGMLRALLDEAPDPGLIVFDEVPDGFDVEIPARRRPSGVEIAGPFDASPEFCETMHALINAKPRT